MISLRIWHLDGEASSRSTGCSRPITTFASLYPTIEELATAPDQGHEAGCQPRAISLARLLGRGQHRLRDRPATDGRWRNGRCCSACSTPMARITPVCCHSTCDYRNTSKCCAVLNRGSGSATSSPAAMPFHADSTDCHDRPFDGFPKGNLRCSRPARPRTRSWANINACYRHRPYPGTVDLFAAEKRDTLGRDFEDPKMGWGSLVKGEINVHRIIGEHLEIIRPPSVNELATQIRVCLRRK